jgi:hypothetical protein
MATVIDVTLFNGRRERLSRQKKDVLLSVRNGSEKSFHRGFVNGPTIPIETEFHDSPADDHVVLASLKHHRDSGFMPVKVKDNNTTSLHLMLIERDATFEFSSFGAITTDHQALSSLLTGSFGDQAKLQYERLQETTMRAPLACVMNIVEALAIVPLPVAVATDGRPTLAHYIAALDLTPALQWLRQDRFFAWCHADIAPTVRTMPTLFAGAHKALHPGSTDSFKQFGFGEANVQITLHENDKGTLGGSPVIKVEFDMDYFRDSASHLLLEVFPNNLKKFFLGQDSRESLTDPALAYALRWMAGEHARPATQRPFKPAFTLKPVI